MKKLLKYMLLLAAVTICTGSFVSCSDDSLPAADALFRPIISEDDNIEQGLDDNNSPYMIIKWDNYKTANQYTLKIEAVDGTDTREVIVDTTTYRFDDLEYDMEYNIYLSSANTDNGLKSKPFTLTTTTLDFPTKLITPGISDLIDIQARISWADGVDYDKLKVFKNSDDELVGEYEVSADENAAKQKIVSGLSPNTSYYVQAFNGGRYLGKKRFSTVASEKYEGNVVDLRGMENSTGWINTTHIDSLIQQYPDQDITIILEGGAHYKYQSVTVPSTTGTIKFVTGLTLAGNAIFNCSGEINVADGNTVGGIAYEKVFFSDNDNNKTSANYGGHYLLNVNSSGHIGSLSYKSCQIKYKRGGIRARSTFQIDNLTFDDCILDSIGGYGIAMCEGSSCISNITMKNCTAANCNRTLVNSVTTAGDINIENCTFVYCVAGNRNFDDVKTCKSFNVKNCILGISGDSPANVVAEGTDATGFRAWVNGADPIPSATGLYFTSDLAWRLTAEGTPAAKFDGTILGTDTKSTFKDPEHSDFTLTSPDAIKAKVGDPRWLP